MGEMADLVNDDVFENLCPECGFPEEQCACGDPPDDDDDDELDDFDAFDEEDDDE